MARANEQHDFLLISQKIDVRYFVLIQNDFIIKQ
jgi:hypothetical protein